MMSNSGFIVELGFGQGKNPAVLEKSAFSSVE